VVQASRPTLVTGATGFVARRRAGVWSRRGHSVRVLVRRAPTAAT